MATAAAFAKRHPNRLRQRGRDFGRGVAYQIAGLPIAVRHRSRRSGGSTEAKLRHAYAHRYWRPRDWSERAELGMALVLWPIVVIALQIAFTKRNGADVARRFGTPVYRQLIDQLKLYLGAGVLPPWYYIFELYREPTTAYARGFIYRWESKAGFLRLLKEGARTPSSELNDKAEFAEQCHQHQIRTAPVLAVLADGSIHFCAAAAEFESDLFVKPVTGRGGKGAERWDMVDAATYQSPGGARLSREALCAELSERSRRAPVLVQRRLSNHPALDRLNNGALSTIRMLTCLNEFGSPEIVGAALRMAIGDNRVVDNLHAGGIATAIDLETGMLGPASDLGLDCRLGWITSHPVSGARIEGIQLPWWKDARDFAVRAHRAFADRILIGWDIAITPDGPVVIEGNSSPDFDIMQRFVRSGLMNHRLGELLAFHVSMIEVDQVPGT